MHLCAHAPALLLLLVILVHCSTPQGALTRRASWRRAGLEALPLTRSDEEPPSSAAAHCPQYCRCGHVTGVTCFSPSADGALPGNLSADTTKLTLYRYKVQEADLQYLTHLEKLYLYDGKVPSAPLLARTVTHVDIINCHLKSLDNIHYQYLPYLQSVNLAYNNVTTANFANLDHLTNLDLSHNPIEKLPGLPSSLIFLNLKHAPLTQQPTTWDEYLPNLKKLVMTGTTMRLPPYLTLPKLEFLDLSHSNFLLLPYLSGLPSLKDIDLSHTRVNNALPNHFLGPTYLRKVDLSYTHLRDLPDHLFTHNPHIRELHIHHTALNYIKDYTLTGLEELHTLILHNNPNMTHIGDISLSSLYNLKILDLSNTDVRLLPHSLRNTSLELLNVDNNTVFCECHSHWLPDYISTLQDRTAIGFNPLRCMDGVARSPQELTTHMQSLNCTAPSITSQAKVTMERGAGQTALLECNTTGIPSPLIIWHSPDQKYYMHHHTELQPWFSDKFKYILNHLSVTNNSTTEARVSALQSGHLLIQNLTREDVGLYRCTAVSSVGSVTVTTFLWLTTAEMVNFEIQSLLFGLVCAIVFMLTTLIVQLIRYIMDRMGWECCCCRGRISSKAQQVKRILESVESYRAQQLDRLRDNYNSQVLTIKDGCYQQMERLSDSYSQQCKNIQSIKDYSTHGLTSLRDQYVDQINKVREYSVGQMGKVYENYVFQRQRVRKFSAHQMFKLRETYKYQQRTLNKILENIPDLYLQNCRTGGNCNRSDSIIFDDEIHGIDAYYRLDFLNPVISSCEGSEDCYFTPSSTLTRAQRHYILQHHTRHHSNCSASICTNDYQEANQSWASNTPANTSPNTSPSHHNKQRKSLKHTRSLSTTGSPKGHQLFIQTHRRTHSASAQPNTPRPDKRRAFLTASNSEDHHGPSSDSECSDSEHKAMIRQHHERVNVQLEAVVDGGLQGLEDGAEEPPVTEPVADCEQNNKQPYSLVRKENLSVAKSSSPHVEVADSDISANHSSSDSAVSGGCKKRTSLSREGSKEAEGKLPSVSEDTEPSQSSKSLDESSL